jgi:TorA maturation chaperone TorD
MKRRAELFRALGALCEAPGPAQPRLATMLDLPPAAAHEHTEVFTLQLYPYASVYVGAEGMLGGEARDRVAGFWRALCLTPPAEPDHLAALLSLYAGLIERVDEDERRSPLARARTALLWEHLLCWLPAYLDKVAEVGAASYARWASLLETALVEEATELGEQDRLPLHLRAGAGGDHDDLVAWLLTPVRSGMVLVRSDLQRAARALDMGTRVGERRFVLQSLLGQDVEAALRWLAAEARRWVSLHRRWELVTGDVARFWVGRAQSAAILLDDRIADAKDLVRQDARR